MARMEFHHHKFALTITIVLVGIIGVLLGIQLEYSATSQSALHIMLFGFTLLLLVMSFLNISILLRFREDFHMLQAQLLDCVQKNTSKTTPVTLNSQKKKAK